MNNIKTIRKLEYAIYLIDEAINTFDGAYTNIPATDSKIARIEQTLLELKVRSLKIIGRLQERKSKKFNLL